MLIFETLAIAAGLGADAMSVSAAVGVKWNGPRQKFRLAWHMGLFQFLMPIIGWAVGTQLASLVQVWGKYLAGAMVFVVGAKMFYEAMRQHPGSVAERAEHKAEEAMHMKDPTRGMSLMILSVATSLDALVVGFSLGVKGAADIWWASGIIGIVAATMSLAGVLIGQRAGAKFGSRAEIAGALILMGLAVSFLFI